MDAIRATAATAAPVASSAATSATTDASSSTTAAKTETKKSFSTLFAEAKGDLKKGEKLTTVTGHQFARIKGGTRDDQCINLSGNDRSGQAFDLIWRNGRQFHVYGGEGADHKVVEVGKKATTKTADSTATGTDTTPATGTSGTTTDSTASTGGTSTAGTTTTSSGSSTSAKS
jgi:hypothetical protein